MPTCYFSHIISPPNLTIFPHSPSRVASQSKRVFEQHKSSTSIICSITKKTLVASGVDVETETAVVEKPQTGRFNVSRGYPSPFGATVRDDGVNFAIYSLNSLSATLCLFTQSDFQNVSSLFISFINCRFWKRYLEVDSGNLWQIFQLGFFFLFVCCRIKWRNTFL